MGAKSGRDNRTDLLHGTWMNVLIKLIDGYGLGDTIQFGVVLKHLRKYRPTWVVDFQCKPGAEMLAVGLCSRVYNDDQTPEGPYDKLIEIPLHDNFNGWSDRPNTKVTVCLHERFGIPYDPDLGRYECRIGSKARVAVSKYMGRIGAKETEGRSNVVILHYQGWSNRHKKDLTDWQAEEICDMVIRAGRIPVIVDLNRFSPLPDNKRIFAPAVHDPLWGGTGHGDAEVLAALIAQAEAFVGVDSGPAHVASATDTPALACWRLHHPLQYHDPAANTIHLIPEHWRGMEPINGDSAIASYFEGHYDHFTYDGDYGLSASVVRWLADALGCSPATTGVVFVVRNNVQSALFAAAKFRGIAQQRPIDIIVADEPWAASEAADRLRAFSFVRSVTLKPIPMTHGSEPNTRGHVHYVSDGIRDGMHFLIPDTVTQTGRPIEDWMPQVPMDPEVLEAICACSSGT